MKWVAVTCIYVDDACITMPYVSGDADTEAAADVALAELGLRDKITLNTPIMGTSWGCGAPGIRLVETTQFPQAGFVVSQCSQFPDAGSYGTATRDLTYCQYCYCTVNYCQCTY
eukprot:SAG22_NODE_9643_length_577_cov_1.834728_1_plen_113_part_01